MNAIVTNTLQITNKIKKFNSLLTIMIFIIVVLLLQLLELKYPTTLQLVIIALNIQIVLMLFLSYKYSFKGMIISIVLNLFNILTEFINRLVTNNLLYSEISFFRFLSIFLAIFISVVTIKQNKFNVSIENTAYIDSVTQIFNRRYLQERLDIEFSKANRSLFNLGVMLLDIDNFKKYNDLFGHKAGDALLKDMADVIKESVRFQDIVARYEGDEYAILIPEIKFENIQMISDRILKNAENYVQNHANAKIANISLSIGYTSYPNIADTRDELISQAESALYRAKQSGRNNIKIYKDVFSDLNLNLNSTENQLMISLKTLLLTVSAKDKYTLGHSERVTEMAINLGGTLGLKPDELSILKISALLHDVGKVEIPQDILNKPGKLTDDEFKIMKMHPVYSADIVESLSTMGNIYKIVKHHHERYDGFGYPDGLKGAEIPLESRILTIVDSFDAMRSIRPYRESYSLEKTITEIIKGKGTQFDPQMVDAFLKLII